MRSSLEDAKIRPRKQSRTVKTWGSGPQERGSTIDNSDELKKK